MIEDYDKALTLDGSYLDELRLTVTMAVNRSEYYFFTNRKGCERCGIALSTHVKKQMCEKFYSRNRFPSGTHSIQTWYDIILFLNFCSFFLVLEFVQMSFVPDN